MTRTTCTECLFNNFALIQPHRLVQLFTKNMNGIRSLKLLGIIPCCSQGKMVALENGGPGDDCIVTVDFPECRGWQGLYSEIELVPGCGFVVSISFLGLLLLFLITEYLFKLTMHFLHGLHLLLTFTSIS